MLHRALDLGGFFYRVQMKTVVNTVMNLWVLDQLSTCAKQASENHYNSHCKRKKAMFPFKK
jgi:hypothetical protein